MSVAEESRPSGWQAHLKLVFEKRGSRTALAKREHHGPLVVQKPFYPEGSPCHVYLLHPPGGVVGGDELHFDTRVADAAHALITTPASNKFYRSQGQVALVRQNLHVQEGGILEWLPQDTILFSGCNVDTLTRVDIESDAKFIGWEILCLGRPASSEQFSSGYCHQRFEVWRNEHPILIERTKLDGDSPALHASWGLSGHSVLGTMIVTPVGKHELQAARKLIHENGESLCSATLINDVLVCRYLGRHGEEARNCFIKIWEVIRPHTLDINACPPRVWKT